MFSNQISATLNKIKIERVFDITILARGSSFCLSCEMKGNAFVERVMGGIIIFERSVLEWWKKAVIKYLI